MNCKTANQLIHPYLNQELNLETADNFLHHIKECKDCREELEIYFTVQAGIDNLNRDEVRTYDLKGLFEEELRSTQSYITKRHILGAIRDVFLALAAAGLAVSCMLQFRIWF